MRKSLEVIFESVVQGNLDGVEAGVHAAIEQSVAPSEILQDGLIAAMKEVGARFERGEFYVPEMLVAARAMKAGLSILKPLLVDEGIRPKGTVVIGTVKGDLHDIGKSLVGMMLEGDGFQVVDVGTDVDAEAIGQAIRSCEPQIVGLSALLTTTMRNMQAIIVALQDMGLRDQVKVIIGGAPVTSEYAHEIGADGYAPDAASAVTLARSLL